MKSITKFGSSALLSLLCLVPALLAGVPVWAATPWDQPAGQLAEQIAGILGAGQAQLSVNNRSTIAASELPSIRKLLEQDLHARGVIISGSESANLIRVTLSENVRERLWIAEVVEGNQTHVAMVRMDHEASPAAVSDTGMILEKKRIWSSIDQSTNSEEPVLAALETHAGLVVLEEDEIVIFSKTAAGWHEENHFPLARKHASSRDAHGLLLSIVDGSGFTAYTAGVTCNGSYSTPQDSHGEFPLWTVHCHESDDPWPIATSATTLAPIDLKAFYNAGRNFFTGIVTPSLGMDLMPFYSIAPLVRSGADHIALLLNSVDGKLWLVDGSTLRPVSGARDWGSDFAAIHSGCGSATQIVVSASGEAASDSLRAYDIPAQEAIATTTPLEMGGTVTALWTAPDGSSTLAIVRKSAIEYEVESVTAICP